MEQSINIARIALQSLFKIGQRFVEFFMQVGHRTNYSVNCPEIKIILKILSGERRLSKAGAVSLATYSDIAVL